MITKRNISLALTALALAATPGIARAEQRETFKVGDTAFSYVRPEGFCLPSGPDVALAKEIAALDKSSVTHANLDRCGSFGEEYTHIKTPIRNEPVTMAKPLFLAVLAREMQNSGTLAKIETAMREVEADIAKGVGEENALKVGSPVFGGQDKDCVYIFLLIDVQFGAEKKQGRASGCLTVIDQQLFSVNSYALVESGITFEALKERSRAVAVSLAKVPAP
ncbi:hypothetical protein [Erythrobacter donghaensis]|jgi:hypothetical protein|uniref:hypothetical protein n=1 Tax=Erythrobacter donghaensis TaxID=267135 RepID=UPI00093F2BB1|nr:hypothetical protein [Erythrobacter donghaensis]